ncbi:MAG: LysE family translocator [Bacteroidia bacterium]|nr:LysE family transporter [Nitrosopumilus sp.]
MHGTFLNGLALGLIIASMTGPVFFALINLSVSKGIEAGAMMIAGVLASNLFLLIILLVSFKFVLNNSELKQFIILATGILLFTLGIIVISKINKKVFHKRLINFPATNPLFIFTKGFLINTFNPFVLFFWLGLMSLTLLELNNTKINFELIIAGALTTFTIIDLLKAIAANKIREKINPVLLVWVNRISGAAFTIFGLTLILKVLI